MLDFRSDTVTKPTKEMREAMAQAFVGDDVYGDDPTMLELEALACEMTGKEAALFVPSGTFGNQVAIMTHTRPSDEVIVLEDSHIVLHEAGAAAQLSGVNLRYAKSDLGEYEEENLRFLIREEDIHHPRTSLICLENAHGNGRVIPLDALAMVRKVADEHGLPVHLDGARLFNAATALEVEAKEICKYVDTVTFCLSKGLCSPVGSILCGTKEFIHRARFNRKRMGGGMRQVGILAAAGLISLREMTKRLEEDHDHANYLGLLLDDIEGIQVLWDRLDINLVYFKVPGVDDLHERLLERDILMNGLDLGEYRAATHHGITREDIDRLIIAIKEILS